MARSAEIELAVELHSVVKADLFFNVVSPKFGDWMAEQIRFRLTGCTLAPTVQ